MNTLDKIILHKIKEVEERKQQKSIKELEASPNFGSASLSLKKFLTDPGKTGIIAEFKKKSPSKGIINDKVTVEEVVTGYEAAGASACSVLTDIEFFGGKDEDLERARKAVNIPLLRKDFIIDEYQIVEAKALGANIILLIAAALEKKTLKKLAEFAKSLGMEVLLEVHNEEELKESVNQYVDVVGVNNRNLKNFEVDIKTSLDLVNKIPSQFLKISESGISDPASIRELRKAGFHGFLIGENFMKTENPGLAMKEFVQKIKG
ncbi:MAG TPA: indole-3-glycerol phosphate synthase TrpC [Cytophagaceae bacterium]